MTSNKLKLWATVAALVISGAWRANAQNAQNASSAESDSSAVKNNYGVLAGDTSVVKSDSVIYDAFEPEPATNAPPAPAATAPAKRKYNISAGVDFYNLSHSFRNTAGSILTWRDIVMTGGNVRVSRQTGDQTVGLDAGFATGSGYGTDDDAMNKNFANKLDGAMSFHDVNVFAAYLRGFKESKARGLSKELELDLNQFNDASSMVVWIYQDYTKGPDFMDSIPHVSFSLLHITARVKYKLNLVQKNRYSIDCDMAAGISPYGFLENWRARELKCYGVGLDFNTDAGLGWEYRLGKNVVFITKIWASTYQGFFGRGQGSRAGSNGSTRRVGTGEAYDRTITNKFGVTFGLMFRTK